jgi:hypothetical protein
MVSTRVAGLGARAPLSEREKRSSVREQIYFVIVVGLALPSAQAAAVGLVVDCSYTGAPLSDIAAALKTGVVQVDFEVSKAATYLAVGGE